jgi:hypothetical protein
MLGLAAIFATLAVAMGIAAALFWLMRDRAAPTPLAAAHATAALAAYALLIATFAAGARSSAYGTASFGIVAAILLGAAILTGLALFLLRLAARRYPGALVGAHATLAVSGFVILAVYALLAS